MQALGIQAYLGEVAVTVVHAHLIGDKVEEVAICGGYVIATPCFEFNNPVKVGRGGVGENDVVT